MATSTDKLIELINSDGGVPFPITEEMINFQSVMPDSTTVKNTKVVVTPKLGSGLVGLRDVFYSRVDLAQMGSGLIIAADTDFTPQLIVDYFNGERNAFLTVADFQEMAIPPLAVSQSAQLTLTAANGSLGWTGSITVTIKRNGTQEELAGTVAGFVLTTMTQPGYW